MGIYAKAWNSLQNIESNFYGLVLSFYGLVVKWRWFNGERKFTVAIYAITTWVISSEKT